ncbi:MAG: amidase family protein [archaeon]
MIKQKVTDIKKGKMTAMENVMQFTKKIDKVNKDLNIYLSLNEYALKQAEEIDRKIKKGESVGKLAGICFAVKSNICVENMNATCASKVLESFTAPYSASVINDLIDEDAIVLGMVNMDEFACGASGETSAFGATKNPVDKSLIPGGSSSGSAAAVAADLCDFALGSDTGGSIRNPASHCGIVGLKPSYGSVSRYGLIDMAMSFDCIGPLASSVEDIKFVFDVIRGQDNLDSTTVDFPKTKETKNLTVGLVDVRNFCDEKIASMVEKKTNEVAKKNGWKVKKIILPLDIALETYYLIVYVEFFSATRKFDGRRFGLKIDEHGGVEVIRRILGGQEISQAEYSGKYYRSALKARNYIRAEFEKLFGDVDVVVLPTVPRTAHKIGEKISVKEMYGYDVLTVLANIAGIPAISIPAGEIGGKKVGLQVMSSRGADDLVLDVAERFE